VFGVVLTVLGYVPTRRGSELNFVRGCPWGVPVGDFQVDDVAVFRRWHRRMGDRPMALGIVDEDVPDEPRRFADRPDLSLRVFVGVWSSPFEASRAATCPRG